MKTLALPLLAIAVAALAQSPASMPMPMSASPAAGERLGSVSFAVSCSQQVQAAVQPRRRSAARFLVRRGAAAV